MTADLNTLREALEPCPFCAHVGLDFKEGSTFRWIIAECGGCGASRGETRIQTFGEGTKEEWMADAREDAIREWNRRAPRLEAAAAAEYERGRQDGMKQEHALWQMQRIGQEIEAAADHIVDANKMVPELSREDVVRLAREAGIEFQTNEGITGRVNMSTRGSQKIEKIERFASLVRSVPPTGENHAAHENQLGRMPEAPSSVRADQSPTAGMNIAQRILHVGGRNNAAGYVEFGSIQAVEALVRQVLRDLPESPELERLRADVKVYRDAWAAMLAVPVGEVKPVACVMRHNPVWKTNNGHHFQESNFSCASCGYVGKHDTHPGCQRTTPPAPIEGWRMVPESALQWLFGEAGSFECPPERYFRGKPAPFWWRSVFRELIAAAPQPGDNP